MGSKVPVAGYRVGMLIDGNHVMEAVMRHGEVDMGVHVGCGIMETARETLLKEFCSGIMDEFNFSNYYAIDFYDYDIVGRCVLKALLGSWLKRQNELGIEGSFPCAN